MENHSQGGLAGWSVEAMKAQRMYLAGGFVRSDSLAMSCGSRSACVRAAGLWLDARCTTTSARHTVLCALFNALFARRFAPYLTHDPS